jgi:hypothetical protein
LAKYRSIRENDRIIAEREGFLSRKLQGERPPLCSLAGWFDEKLALECGQSVDETGKEVNMALAMWAKVSAAPDAEVAVKDKESSNEKEEGQKEGGVPIVDGDGKRTGK